MEATTIFAPATAKGRAGLAVIRISGPRAGRAVRELTGWKELPVARRATRAMLMDRGRSEVVDDGLVLWFPGPASFTGEDVAELHIHGGRAVMAAVLDALGAMEGLRWAEPGEFTRRGFINGKMDLTAAEGLADLVAAETEAQRKQALRQLHGELGGLYEGWRRRLVRALGYFEAAIDFSDEEVPDGTVEEGRLEVAGIVEEIRRHLNDGRRGERLRDGVHVTIVGAPNVGKSSLLNRLARRDVAIVSELAGTTRDVIEVHLDLGGYPLVIADTAGLREGGEGVENEGIRRARDRAANSDLKVAIFDVSADPMEDRATADLVDEDTVVVVNKIDHRRPGAGMTVKGRKVVEISVRTGEGVQGLLDELKTRVKGMGGQGEGMLLTRSRHRAALEEAERGLAAVSEMTAVELAAEEVRKGAEGLGRITGRVGVEEVLDLVFREFCIGK